MLIAAQASFNFDAFLEHVVDKASGSRSNGSASGPEKLEIMKSALKQIDVLGVEGAAQINEQEV